MGIAGAAWATVIGQCLGAVVAVILNHCKNPEIHLRLRHIRPSGKLMGEITAISIPSIIMSCISSLTCFVMDLILITFSSTAVAVFGVYFKLQSFVFMPVFGLNNGMVPIIAYNYGAQKPERIHKTIRLGMLYAVIIMALGFLVFQLIPKELLSMFDASDAMLEIGAPALRIMSLAFIFAGISIVDGSSCQAFVARRSSPSPRARQIVVLIPAWSFPPLLLAGVLAERGGLAPSCHDGHRSLGSCRSCSQHQHARRRRRCRLKRNSVCSGRPYAVASSVFFCQEVLHPA